VEQRGLTRHILKHAMGVPNSIQWRKLMKNNAMKQITSERFDTDWLQTLDTLGPGFDARAAEHDREGSFVTANYDELREYRYFSAAIPAELGGGGACYAQLTDVIRTLGRFCGSTALAYAMHSHPVAVNVFKHLHGDPKATATLRKIAASELVIAGTGANDWLDSSGEAVRVEGGYRVTAHKRFVSGAAGADVFVSSARFEGEQGVEVLHFSTPFAAEGVRLIETWDALGMRGTGSHEVLLEEAFVPDAAVVARRPAGIWHPMWNVILPTALPLITAAYIGLAERAVELAIAAARHKPEELASVVGEMTTAMTLARSVHTDMVHDNGDHAFTPSLELAELTLARKSVATDAIRQVVELAAELVGGPGFMRGHPMEPGVRSVTARGADACLDAARRPGSPRRISSCNRAD
jgi:alkylation response protein AidB-like acyl-CoA dehydrogenase